MPWKQEQDISNISEILLPILEAYRATDNEQYRIFSKNMLRNACRQLERFMVPRVSIRAAQEASSLGVGDLSRYNWGHQRKEMKDPKRSIFHWEHVYPVSSAVGALIELNEPSIDGVKIVLKKADIAWVLKAEDKILNQNKFRSKRPKNPWDAYVICGIELVPLA